MGGGGGGEENTFPKCFCLLSEKKLLEVCQMCSSYVIAKNYVIFPLLSQSMMTVIGPSYLDQKDFILWTKFYSPGGLWQHKVG